MQAALAVLGRRTPQAQERAIDLRGTDLRAADLRKAQLQDPYLTEAPLDGAYLTGAQLEGTKLSGAQLEVHTCPPRPSPRSSSSGQPRRR